SHVRIGRPRSGGRPTIEMGDPGERRARDTGTGTGTGTWQAVGMATVLFCPIMFNLAEVTRMIEVARALDPRHTAVFMGYERDFAHLVRDAGFDYRAQAPALTRAERDQVMRFDQGRALRTPFTD